MTLGYGAYQGATIQSILTADTGVALFHQCPQVAEAWRETQPWGLSLVRGDEGRDNEQYDASQPPESEARRFVDRFIHPALDGAKRSIYSIVCGPNERMDPSDTSHEYRGRLELAICRIAQGELNTPYGALSCSVGLIDPPQLRFYLDVFREAFAIVYHGYLAPTVRRMEDEREPYHLFRPTRLWAPELRRQGIEHWRLILGECGTYYSPRALGMTAADQVRVCAAIDRAMNWECKGVDVEYLGAIPFGFGVLGDMAGWELAGTESLIAQAQPVIEQPVEVQTMRLRDQYPSEWAAWDAAGGPDHHLLAYLIGIGRIQPTREHIPVLIGNTASAAKTLEAAYLALPK